MKLLFDANLSHRLAEAVASEYPGSIHLRDAGLQRADDAAKAVPGRATDERGRD